MDTCTCTAESMIVHVTITTLFVIGYTPEQNKKFFFSVFLFSFPSPNQLEFGFLFHLFWPSVFSHICKTSISFSVTFVLKEPGYLLFPRI